MPFEILWQFDFASGFDVVPPVDTRTRSCCPDVISRNRDLVHALMLLAYGYGQALVHLGAISYVALRYDTGSIGRVEYGELWRVREQGPDTVVVHRERIPAKSVICLKARELKRVENWLYDNRLPTADDHAEPNQPLRIRVLTYMQRPAVMDHTFTV